MYGICSFEEETPEHFHPSFFNYLTGPFMSTNFTVRLLLIRFSHLNRRCFHVRIPAMNTPKLGELEEKWNQFVV